MNNPAAHQISFRQSTKYDVNDAFYEQLVYENLEYIIQKYQEMQINLNRENKQIGEELEEEKQSKKHLELNDNLTKQMHQEIENVGVSLGRKIIDIITKD